MNLKNFTPHAINIIDKRGNVTLTLPSLGSVRVSERTETKGDVNGIPLVSKVYKEAEGLPPCVEGTMLIVSLLVKNACPGRYDLVSPDTGPESVVRDSSGKILGVRRLQV